MDNLFENEENAKNIYVIKHNLNSLKKKINTSYYECNIDPFRVVIFTDESDSDKFITQCEKVDVQIFESLKRRNIDRLIDLLTDIRFKNYQPIQYDVFHGPNGDINFSDGQNMPILQLCELIRYLHRLSKLTVFM